MSFEELVGWSFKLMASGIATWAIFELRSFRQTADDVKKSINDLNQTVGKLIVRNDAHEARTNRLESQVIKLDDRLREVEISHVQKKIRGTV